MLLLSNRFPVASKINFKLSRPIVDLRFHQRTRTEGKLALLSLSDWRLDAPLAKEMANRLCRQKYFKLRLIVHWRPQSFKFALGAKVSCFRCYGRWLALCLCTSAPDLQKCSYRLLLGTSSHLGALDYYVAKNLSACSMIELPGLVDYCQGHDPLAQDFGNAINHLHSLRSRTEHFLAY